MVLVRRRDTESLASSMKNKMKIKHIISPESCIFRVPSTLKRHNEAAYVPNAFSIGPFHHGKDSLKDAEMIKHAYLEDLVERKDSATLLNNCIDAVKGVVDEARKCYVGDIGMFEEDFIEMLVLDGCFIIELLRKDEQVGPKDTDPVFSMSCMLQFLYHDLILLENQIPWLVLEELFRLTGGLSESKSLTQLALDFFDCTFTSEKVQLDIKLFANKKIKHILDLLRLSLVLPLDENEHQSIVELQPLPSSTTLGKLQPPKVELEPLPTATTITASGIKFQKVASRSILDVKFIRGTIEMPPLLIQASLEPTFRNLVSYEQCYPNCLPKVTCYCLLLDSLINTTEDVDELGKSGVLINWLAPQLATHLFQRLCKDAHVKDLYYNSLCLEVKKHRRKWWPRWRTFYVHNYFGKPWAIVSQVVAGILLVLTVLQTVSAWMPGKK